jgi:hypothetical protein
VFNVEMETLARQVQPITQHGLIAGPPVRKPSSARQPGLKERPQVWREPEAISCLGGGDLGVGQTRVEWDAGVTDLGDEVRPRRMTKLSRPAYLAIVTSGLYFTSDGFDSTEVVSRRIKDRDYEGHNDPLQFYNHKTCAYYFRQNLCCVMPIRPFHATPDGGRSR